MNVLPHDANGWAAIASADPIFAINGERIEIFQMGLARPNDVVEENVGLEPDAGNIVELRETGRISSPRP